MVDLAVLCSFSLCVCMCLPHAPDHAERMNIVDHVAEDQRGEGEADDERRLQQAQKQVGGVGPERLCGVCVYTYVGR